jgi:RHS repeat-associated protein
LSVGGSATLTLTYDPLGRLRTTNDGTTTTTFLYSGDQLVSEYITTSLEHRYVFGAGVDRPIVWYHGDDLATPQWLHADELGSVIAVSDDQGDRIGDAYSYSPYGEPDPSHNWTGSRFRYTGQIMLPEAQLYHYKARAYDPVLGRFLQTDPVGYEQSLNLYGYADGDPLGRRDPTGSCWGEMEGYCRSFAEGFFGNDNGVMNELQGTPQYSGANDLGQLAGKAADTIALAVDVATIPSGEGLAFSAARQAAGAVARQADEGVSIYRAVQPGELSSIERTGAFSNPAGIENKYFSTTAEGAASYGRQAGTAYRDGPYTIVESSIPRSAIADDMIVPGGVDGGIPTIVVPTTSLPSLSTPLVWNYSPVPTR